jgi:hypothetical protein
MPAVSDTTPLGELHPELRSRVSAAAGHAAEVEVVPEGAGYRISAVSGDTTLDMYLEMRPDGSVEERTQVRQRSPKAVVDKTATGKANVMNMETMSDEELLDRLRAALADVVKFGQTDPAVRREAWQRVIEGIRNLEGRYPPESEESV